MTQDSGHAISLPSLIPALCHQSRVWSVPQVNRFQSCPFHCFSFCGVVMFAAPDQAVRLHSGLSDRHPGQLPWVSPWFLSFGQIPLSESI